MEQQNHEDEISLKELILTLVHNWKIIFGCTLIFAVGMLIYLFGFASPVYQSELEGMTNMYSVSTKYGSYEFPSESPMDYLSVARNNDVLVQLMEAFDVEGAVENFRDRIEIQEVEESSKFVLTMKAEDPEEAKAMLEMLADLTMENLERTYRTLAVETFVNKYALSTLQLQDQKILESNRLEAMKSELALIQPTITLKKLAVDDPAYLALIAEQRETRIETLTEDALLEEVINPHYLSLQGLIIELRKSLQDIEVNLEKNERYLNELQEIEETIREYRTTGDKSAYEAMDIRVFTNQILFSEQASYPENRISPRRGLNMAIAIVLGGMIGVFLAFFKAYWKEEKYV